MLILIIKIWKVIIIILLVKRKELHYLLVENMRWISVHEILIRLSLQKLEISAGSLSHKAG